MIRKPLSEERKQQKREQNRLWYLKNAERIKAGLREARAANPEEVRRRESQYRRARRIVSPERARTIDAVRRDRHRDQIKRANASSYLRRKEVRRQTISANPLKFKARAKLSKARHTGKIVPAPCRVCGCDKVDGHHFDYRLPLSVIWLCRKHHAAWHRLFLTEDTQCSA